MELNREHKPTTGKYARIVIKDPYQPNVMHTPYCPGSGKAKMQFSTENEADRFILYNSDRIAELKGYAPIRSYYCNDCRCWHVTSKPQRYRQAYNLDNDMGIAE